MYEKFKKIKKFWLRENYDILEGTSYMTEKLDGANFSFHAGVDGEPIFRSHNQEINLTKKHNFNRAIDFVSEKLVESGVALNPDYVYYGEAMMPHTLNYGGADATDAFIGFAVKNVKHGIYIKNWSEKIEAFGLPVVSQLEVYNGDYDELIAEYLHAESDYGNTNTIREGLVFFNPTKQMFAKVVRDKFKEQNRIAFGGNKQQKPRMPEDDIAGAYATEARIRKQINIMRLVECRKLEMKMMLTLPQFVLEDIIAEEIGAISTNVKVIDFSALRAKIAPLCVPVLQGMMSEVGEI